MKKDIKPFEDWLKKNPKDAKRILKILEISSKYHASSLEPILYPQVKMTSTSPSIKL